MCDKINVYNNILYIKLQYKITLMDEHVELKNRCSIVLRNSIFLSYKISIENGIYQSPLKSMHVTFDC